ncbi:MAG TPA: alpha/beta hydrolase [Burkholderiales bacterium]|nr:alpha/beta hydrolase [Burkholderiales bacterium]
MKALLERVARSPLPPYHTVPAFVARRIYHDTRAALAPQAPALADVKLLVIDNRIAVRVYRPSGDVLPALVFFHGGGWTIGDLDTHDVLCRQLAAGASCAVFSVDYRLAPENPFPAAVEDALVATRYVASNPGLLKIDPKRIAVGGDSAGGNLAAVVALELRKHDLAYQLLIYPATDQRCEFDSHRRNGEGYLLTREAIDFFRGAYLPDRAHWTDWRASPLLAADHRGVAPAYIVTAGLDPLLDEGHAYADKLMSAGVRVDYREYSDMVHGFILFGGVVDTANAAVAECCARLRDAFAQVET